MSIILEAPDMTEDQSNVGATQDAATEVVTESPETQTEQVEGAQETKPEATIKIGDREVPLSKAEQVFKDFENDQGWKDKNRRESEELNTRRKEIAQLELLKPMLDQHPEILQSLFAPKTQRNFDAEIKDHYSKRPDDFDPAKLSAWEYERDRLNAERLKSETQSQIESVRSQEEARIHNERVGIAAEEKYVKSGKVAQGDLERMADWIASNLQIKNGKAPVNAFDLAYREMFSDRYDRDIRADATKRTVTPLTKATSGGADAGLSQRTPMPSPSEADDNDFVRAVKEQTKGHYTKI